MSIACLNCGAENPDSARFCSSCAKPLAHEQWREERKLATVLFADLVGSTSLADEQDPERTRLMLNRFYDAMAEEVERHGGTIEKFAGDAVMAAFGAPAALEDHAERALHASLAMHTRLQEMFAGRLALRIGVNTGEVIVGRPREGSSFVTGDAVNVAARLEQAAEPGETIAGERTVSAVSGAFEFSEPIMIEAKGKPEGVPARRVLRALSLVRPRGLQGMPYVFVGRESDMVALQSRYAGVAESGTPHLVSILGDAGVGKSRLIRELQDWLAGQSPAPTHLTGRVLSYGRGTTYWPMGEVLKQYFGISEGDTAESVTATLVEHPYLALTLGVDTTEQLHPLVARERLHDAWVEFLNSLTSDRPVVLVIEDVHWAEHQLGDLIDLLVAQVSGSLLVLVTARPEVLERRPAWGGARDRTSALHLDALAASDTGRLLGDLLGVEVPDQIRSLVVERAEGNPFFVEELIATFVDRGVLQRQDGSWSFGEIPAGFSVPDSVQAVLAARIDLLPEAEKAALQAAAVIGRTFWTGPMYELAAGARPDIAVLEEREFVLRRATSSLPGEREYTIKHALTREVAYESLPRARRAQLHAEFAAWLDRRMDGRDELAPLVAHHYAAAVRPEDLDLAWVSREGEVRGLSAKAVEWLRKAADVAISRYEIDDGLSLLNRAVELEPEPAAQAELWSAIGHASALKYDGEAFVAAMERALELSAPPAEVYAELAFQWSQRVGMWGTQLDDSLTESWMQQAMTESQDGTPPRVKALVARALSSDNVDLAREALALAERLDDLSLRDAALGSLESALFYRGNFDEALGAASTRIALQPQVSDPDRAADTYYITTDVYVAAGRFTEARAMADRMEETVARLTPHHRVHGLAVRMWVERAEARWDAIRDLTPVAEELMDTNRATPCPYNRALLTDVAIAWRHAENEIESDRLLALAEEIGMATFPFVLTPLWIGLAIARNDHAEVRRLIDSIHPAWLLPGSWDHWAAMFDGLADLDDRERIEVEAAQWLGKDLFVTPFATRALALARRDEGLRDAAVAQFERMGLERRAEETRALYADAVAHS